AEYQQVTDAEAMDAFALLSRTEGIIPAVESAHALAGALRIGREWQASGAAGEPPVILVSLSGRGDKDTETAMEYFDLEEGA
ncbi:MAG: tryptophan synthase subunit beta, partial [Actinomycetaceae bacterium]